jgi:hypothetical protein
MKTLRLAVLAAVAVGCHFDKLFQPAVHASRSGSAATQLRFTTQPHSAMKDSTIRPPVQVTAFDSTGSVVTSFTGNVTVAIGHDGGSPGPAHLTGDRVVAAVNGVATFANLRIDQIGTGYTLTAAASTLAGDTSDAFDITATPPTGPGAATKLLFVAQPTNTVAGATISPPVRVAAVDDQNNIVTTFNGSIRIAIGHNGGLLKGTLSGTLLQPVVNGVATFSDLSIDQAGTDYYTLTADNPQLGVIESARFSITVL